MSKFSRLVVSMSLAVAVFVLMRPTLLEKHGEQQEIVLDEVPVSVEEIQPTKLITLDDFKSDFEESSTEIEEIVVESLEKVKAAEEARAIEKAKALEKARIASESKSNPKPIQRVSRGVTADLGVFKVTCYDLSVQSCGKPIGSKGYGITASGFDLTGHSWDTARSIAVDPRVIPLGSKVEITFTNEKYSKYNGIYTARDTGGAIKQRKIDFFLGDFHQNKTHQSVWDFGVTQAKLKIIK